MHPDDELDEHEEGDLPQGFNPKFLIDLSGRNYPTWPGVLDLAHRQGLVSLDVEAIQFPTTENDYTAICKATAKFADGRSFSDVGDASGQNVNKRIATALLRMASTRAKGRCLRDALNVGVVLAEELPATMRAGQPDDTGRTSWSEAATDTSTRGQKPIPACRECGTVLTSGQAAFSERNYGRPLCTSHQQGAPRGN